MGDGHADLDIKGKIQTGSSIRGVFPHTSQQYSSSVGISAWWIVGSIIP